MCVCGLHNTYQFKFKLWIAVHKLKKDSIILANLMLGKPVNDYEIKGLYLQYN